MFNDDYKFYLTSEEELKMLDLIPDKSEESEELVF